MKNVLKKALAAFMALLTVTTVCAYALPASSAVTVEGFTDEDFLTTKGMKLVNRTGKEVKLKGVNLGGWMIWEDWLCPFDGLVDGETTDHMEIIDVLTGRFGEEGAYKLMNTYMDNWITEQDLDEIKAMGFNCVRVPFWFRNFYYDDNGRKILNENGEWDFSRLDWVVNECSERELYVVLDMHGAVGYQSDAAHNGKQGACGLYEETQQGERYRELTDELWTAIASRFKNNPAVAMYDLLNEPMCDVEATEIERRIKNEIIYTRLYDTVRSVDKEHIITMECIWTAAALPHAEIKNWKNVVYQVHFYQNSNFIFNLFCFLTKLYFFGKPLMMGEFYPHKQTTWSNCFNTMNKLNYNWFLWTYKATGHGMWSSDWCLRGSKNGFERANVQTDTFEEIARKWGSVIQTENGFQDTGHYENNVKDFL